MAEACVHAFSGGTAKGRKWGTGHWGMAAARRSSRSVTESVVCVGGMALMPSVMGEVE